ncbi:MAG TPA: DNA mismatch repair protein MutS [bacterium]|nr:DNA mismatch repair protein MutS [bacterium]
MMKVFLLHSDRDFNRKQALPSNAEDLSRDLGLDTLFASMAQDDTFLRDVVRRVVFTSLTETETIFYRQDVLRDCLAHPNVIRELYHIPLEYMERKRGQWLWISPRHSNPGSILSNGRRMLEASLDLFYRLRELADHNMEEFQSKGFHRFVGMIQQELDDGYLAEVEKHVHLLKFPRGVLLKAGLGKGNEGTKYILCKPTDNEQSWFKRLFSSNNDSYTYTLHPRDTPGARILGELQSRGIARAANSVAQAAEHIESFFKVLRWELAFYIGCINLHEQLTTLNDPVTFPRPQRTEIRRLSCTGLYNVILSLTKEDRVVGNDVSAYGKNLTIITGPNQGGKTTFLRSVGLAQLMMQCGMFVPAEAYSANLSPRIFTYFKREEDETMEHGKFEEELVRMDTIVNHLTPDALVLLNESFAATNEREGSEIAWQIIRVLLKKHIQVMFVTHLYDFSRRADENLTDTVLYLRAERLSGGRRTFKLNPGKPLETSFSVDLYRKIFQGDRSS